MKIRASAKIAIGFVALSAAVYFGWQLYAGITVDSVKFEPLKPSRVNIVGINPESGYGILVANHAAQLVQGGPGKFEAGGGPENASDPVDRKRVPIREMLQAMQGDSEALGQVVAVMNDMQETVDWPTERIVWKDEDVRKAIAGDPVLKPKLEAALNVTLDGVPLRRISLTAYENGIIVETKVACKVQVGSEVRQMEGPLQVPFRPRLSGMIATQLKDKAYDLVTLAGHYALQAQKVAEGGQKENVAASLERIIDPSNNAMLAEPAEQVLRSATVVVNDTMIESASYRSYTAGRDQLSDMTIQLNEEGRKRLWQFSRRRVGSQLLLIVDGVAIAAPRIGHELAQGELQITQLPDRVLVQDAVDAINKKTGEKA
jgi:hypothetical protein